MLKAILQVIRIVLEEAGRRRWVNALKLFAALVSFIGFSVIALDPILRWLFPSSAVAAWVIIVTLAVVITLLVAVNFMRTFYERALVETRAEWDRREPLLEKLYALRLKGRALQGLCDGKSRQAESLSEEDLRQIRMWHQDAASFLENKLGLEYRRRFYEHSETGETAPTSPHYCATWLHDRRHKLRQVIDEVRQPPPRLITGAEVKQLEAGIRLEGRDPYDD